jgi:hypothetical protein
MSVVHTIVIWIISKDLREEASVTILTLLGRWRVLVP